MRTRFKLRIRRILFTFNFMILLEFLNFAFFGSNGKIPQNKLRNAF